MAVFGVLVAMLMVSAPAATADAPPKVTICHFVHGNGETKDGYNIISIAQAAWDRGHSNSDDDADTQKWTHDERDVVYDGKACPTVPTTLYTVTGYAGPLTVCTTTGTLVIPQQSATATWGTNEEADFDNLIDAQDAADKAALKKLNDLVPADSTPGRCESDGTLYEVVGYAGPMTVCRTTGTVVIPQQVSDPVTWGTSEEATYDTALEAQTAADNAAAAKLADLAKGTTPGACLPPGSTDVTRSYTVNGTADFCPVGGTETVTVTYTGSGTATKATEAEAVAAAQGLAELAAKADLANKTPTDATTGACAAVTVAPVEPGTVAPVEPATVAVPAAATVPVPTSAPLPATVPAGDGGSVPQLPILGWVLVVLATTALAVSAVRLAAGSTR